MSYLNLEHKLLEVFKKESLDHNLIVSVSGGMDSMVLLGSLLNLQKQLRLSLVVGYVHHGRSDYEAQQSYRDQCYELVKGFCEINKVKFISNNNNLMPESILSSEEEFRAFRIKVYGSWLQEFKGYKIALGHHKNDLLENQLIQMIRGCGEKGFLSMSLKSDNKIRPMINMTKLEVQSYAEEKSIKYLDDPSNSQSYYLRNWLRNEWLPQLEEYRPGAVKTMANSLGNLGRALMDNSAQFVLCWSKVYNASRQSLSVDLLLLETEAVSLSLLAEYLRLNNSSKFSRNQLKEILKHLDTPQKKHSFKMLNLSWLVQGGEVHVQQN